MYRSFSHLRKAIGVLTLLSIFISIQKLRAQSVEFNLSTLNFNSFTQPEKGTSLKFGPDGKLYLSELNGLIRIYTIINTGANSYTVTNSQTLFNVQSIPNHDDTGALAWDKRNTRQITGITVAGTAENPVIYVGSSDPKWGGPSGDKALDTNSGILTRLTWTGSEWDVVDLVRGLPRSEENHSTNGLEFTMINGKPFLLVTSGGLTNAGAPSNNFAFITEYALSAAVLSVDLEAIDALPTQIDSRSGRKYKYDIPTLDDPSRANLNGIYNPNDPGYNGIDVGDPFGGNDGLNMGMVIENGPVQIFSAGYRNTYDLVVTHDGKVFLSDNGANANWGGLPENEGNAQLVTNNYLPNEPGNNSTNPASNGEYVSNEDHLLMITSDINNYQPGNFYGGHPAPVRANPGIPYVQGSPFPFNPGGAGLYTNTIADNASSTGIPWYYTPPLYTPSAFFRTEIKQPIAPGQPGFDDYARTSLPVNWPPVPLSLANPNEADYRDPNLVNPNGPQPQIVTIWQKNTNALDEYNASNFGGALKGALIAGRNSGRLHLVLLNPDGSLKSLQSNKWNLNGGNSLGITCNDDNDIFPGTIWVATLDNRISILTPSNNEFCPAPGDIFFDPNADYDNDGFTNQDEIDNGTEYCSGASRPTDFDGDFISDLNDLDDDNDGILDESDPFQLGTPFDLPVNNELFSDKVDPLGRPLGYLGLGLTGLMNNSESNPNWLNWLDVLDSGPLSNDIYGGAAGAIQLAITGGTANGIVNNQDKGFQFGVNVGNETGEFIISSKLLGMSGPQMFFDIDHNGEVGIQMGDGTQSNFLKLVITKTNIIAALELDDIPDSNPLTIPLPVNVRPSSSEAVEFILKVNPLIGTVEPQVKIGQRESINLGTIQLSGVLLEAVQDLSKPLAIGFIGTSADITKEFLATFDNFIVSGEQPYVTNQIPEITRQVSSPDRVIDLANFFGDNFGIENLSFSLNSNILSSVEAEIVGSTLTLSFSDIPYSGLVTVRATDAFGYFVEQTFNINVVRANSIVYRVNAGGEGIPGENNGTNWIANTQNGTVQGEGYSVNNGTSTSTTFNFENRHSSVPNYISEPSFNAVFSTQRENINQGNMRFNIPLPEGVYIVNLYLGENGNGNIGVNQRKFDIRLEGQTKISNLDLVGKYGLGVAAVEQFEVHLTDGSLTIDFIRRIGNPVINGIEIIGTTLADPITITNVIPDQESRVNEELDGNLLFTATGGVGTLIYSATNLPPGIDIEPVNGRLYGTVDPSALANPSYNVTLLVSDSNSPIPNTEFSNFTWTILPNDVWTPANENQNYTARHENSFVQAGESFYVMGGRENAKTIDVYNYKEDSWRAISNVAPKDFNHFQAIEYKGLIWVIGAFETNSYPNETPASHIWIFDPVKEQYMQGPEIPLARRRGSAGLVLHNDKFYVIGGNKLGHNGQYVAYFDQFDPATGVWTVLQDAPRPRDHFSAAMIGNKIYVATGRLSMRVNDVFTFGPVIPEVDVFDFETNSWSTLPSISNIPTPRAAAVVVNYGDKLLVAGGEIPNDPDGTVRSQALAITEILDPVNQTWTPGDNLNFRRHGTQGIVSGNGVWIAGGSPNRGGGNQRNMEYYGENNPTGTPITESNLTGPSNLVLDIDKKSVVTLQVAGGNQSIYLRGVSLSGLDANDFTIITGNLSNSILSANSSYVIELQYTGLKSAPTVTLTVEFGQNSSLQISTNTVTVTGISVSPTNASIPTGSTQQLTATILPSNATNKTVVWTTSNPLVATVNSTGLVSGVAVGTADITARSEDGNFTATASVNVIQNQVPLSIANFVLINAGNNSEIQALSNGTQLLSSQVGSLSLAIRVNTNPTSVGSVFISLSGPVNATRIENGAPYALFGDSNGNYNGRTLPIGNYTLSATAYSGTNRGGTEGPTTTIQFSIVSSSTISVTGVAVSPSSSSIPAGGTQQLTATVFPSDASNTAVTWSSSNPLVATVNPSGLVTGLAAGTATISATTVDGNFISESTITVTANNSHVGLVGQWKLDEGSGNILIDHSGNGNNAELQNTSGVSWIQGIEELGLVLPGNLNRFAIAPHNSSLNITEAITISAWIRPNEVAFRKVLSKSGPDGYEFGTNSTGKVEFRFNGNSSGNAYRLVSNTSHPSNGITWMHIAATFDGTTSRIYINGVLDASATYSPVTIGANTADLKIGAYLDIHRWNGALDDIRLYNRSLSANEILSLYSGEVTQPQVPAVPSLVSPSNGQTGVQTSPTLSWTQAQGAITYQIQVADNLQFNSPLLNLSGTTQLSATLSGLAENTVHYWRVRATNVTGNSDWSVVRSFITASNLLPGSGLAGHWKMDEGSGNTLIDHSGNGNNAILQSTSNVSWTEGIIGQALDLPGTLNRYAIAPHSSSLNITGAITISAWIRPSSVHIRRVLSKTGPNGYELGTSSLGKVEFRLTTSTGNVYLLRSNTDYPSNGSTWMHIAATFDGTTSMIYINGILDISASFAPAVIGSNTSGLYIGSLNGNNRWQGAIDDLRLYGRALSAIEILNLVNSGGAFRTIDNPVIKGGSDDSSENPSLLEKNTQERDTPGVTRMFPNPVLDLINLELSNLQEDRVQVSIFDMKGILLLDREFESENGTLVLDISKLGLKPGTHVLLVNTNGTQQVFKFLKK